MLPRTLIFSLMAAVCLASTTYSVVGIPGPPGFQATGINDSGQVAGRANNVAFIGSTGGSTALPLPPGFTEAYGNAINESGQVAGYANGANAQAFIGTPTGSTAIPLPSGWTLSYGWGINDSGQVVGEVHDASGDGQAFIGTIAGSTLIPLPVGWISSVGFAVNDSGQVAGQVQNGSALQAFIGTSSGSTVIPLPSGWSEAFAYSINASGEVDGYGYNGTNNQAFVGTVAGSTAIPLPPGATFAVVYFDSLNDLGVVVGGSDVGPWMWDATDGTVLLASLLPSGVTVQNAISINNSGIILGVGSCLGSDQVLELTPTQGQSATCAAQTPEPGTFALAGLGLLLAGFACRKRYRAILAAAQSGQYVNCGPWASPPDGRPVIFSPRKMLATAP